MSELVFANVICGVIRGALEMIHMRVECRFTSDMLKGDPINTIRYVCPQNAQARVRLCSGLEVVVSAVVCRWCDAGRRLELKEMIEEAAGEDYKEE